jgi:hypothetical protein
MKQQEITAHAEYIGRREMPEHLWQETKTVLVYVVKTSQQIAFDKILPDRQAHKQSARIKTQLWELVHPRHYLHMGQQPSKQKEL